MDYTNLYSTRIQKTFDEDQADILYILRNELFRDPKLTVQLINYYKGLPISYIAKVAYIDRNTLDLDVSTTQAVAISSERYTFIRSKLFKFDILARVQYINIRRKAVSIRQLCYVEIMAERRNSLRLELDSSINGVFMTASETVSGRIAELSLYGALMIVKQISDDVLTEESVLHLMLPDSETDTIHNVMAPARIVGILDDSKPIHYMFAITPDQANDRLIAKYLFHRQVAIVHELKDGFIIG